MQLPPEDIPTSQNLCGTFVEPDDADQGRAFSAPIVQSCEGPTQAISADAAVTFIDDTISFS